MRDTATDYISPDEAVTLHGLFLERARRTPDRIAYRYFDDSDEQWKQLTWAEVRARIACWQAALLRENLAPGERVAIMLRNCPEWVMFEQAAMSLGLAVVPLYVVDRAENIAWIINDAQVRVMLFETPEQWRSLRPAMGDMSCVRRFVSLGDCSAAANGDSRLQRADAWLPVQAAELLPEQGRDGGKLATIMYTSGTTGKPKGVMLSHHNILSNAYTALLTFPATQSDILLSFLPLSHAFERTGCYVLSMVGGMTVAYARSISHLADDLLFIRPTILMAVPRIYERVYDSIHSKLAHSSAPQRWLFALTEKTGWRRFQYQQGHGAWHPQLLLWPLLKLLVAGRVMARLGGRMRLSVSGGAALRPEVSRLFISLGLPLLQGYGMTETSPVISVNSVGNNRPATVGAPLRDIQVKIGEHDALLVKGPCVMLGYWNNPEATSAILDADGWINTGDTARIGEDGYITITGRLKEIIVMSNGEKVPPADMEAAILRDRLFDQVMVCGEGRSALAVLAVVNHEQWLVFAREEGVQGDTSESLRDTRLERKALQRIAAQLKEFPGYAKVRRVLLLNEPWSIESGLMTPTLKLKRNTVLERFYGEIDRIYHGL